LSHIDNQVIAIDGLRIGQYVHLDLKWFEHPFAFGHFKIKSQEQIDTLRDLGLKTVRISPDLGDAPVPLPPGVIPLTAAVPALAVAAAAVDLPEAARNLSPIMRIKHAMVEEMRVRREDARRVENAFVNSAKLIRDLERDLYSKPQETVQQANKLIGQIADSILAAPELAIQVMGDRLGGEEQYFHSLNVTVLSIMMARDLKLPVEVAGVLGVGALLHDIGRKEVPDRILLKTEALTQAERNLYEMHCHFGVEMALRLSLPPAAIAIIREHHELFDGSGYPAKLKGEEIKLLARIVAIANYYDELCNPPSLADALTPHEALSLMFSRLRSKFDPRMLQILIRCLGVYPPGTIVQLSNGALGMVVTVNTSRPTKPTLLVYDEDVPREEAIMLDMDRETEFNIAKAIRPSQVARNVYSYLSPRKRISYYFDASTARREAGKT
jgi:putative nucleotidyltransferase with HDIG domain